jgi:hypothetical protein
MKPAPPVTRTRTRTSYPAKVFATSITYSP